jgi:hypothetical protein
MRTASLENPNSKCPKSTDKPLALVHHIENSNSKTRLGTAKKALKLYNAEVQKCHMLTTVTGPQA